MKITKKHESRIEESVYLVETPDGTVTGDNRKGQPLTLEEAIELAKQLSGTIIEQEMIGTITTYYREV